MQSPSCFQGVMCLPRVLPCSLDHFAKPRKQCTTMIQIPLGLCRTLRDGEECLRKKLLGVLGLFNSLQSRSMYMRYIEQFLLYLHLQHPEVWRVMPV